MLAKTLSATLVGIEAHVVEVEVDIASRGLPHFSIVGLPDTAVKESRDRVRAALKNVGFQFPLKPVTINLAPADLKKEGSSFDLPIALGLAAAEGVITRESLGNTIFLGELSLDGRIKPVRGALSVAIRAKSENARVILPRENAPEAAVVEGVQVIGVESLPEVIDFLRGAITLAPQNPTLGMEFLSHFKYDEDFSEIKGQEHVKRAVEVAVAGGHNMLMIGPPGSGKTMIARRLPTIMPRITFDEAIDSTRIHSVAGLMRPGEPLLAVRPFRSPHHTISDVALVGGGTVPRPGEVSLANNGVLFLDELPEFKRSALEVLRQPLENGDVTISRATGSLTFPAGFMLVAAMNPCPCGFWGDDRRQCACSAGQIQRYRKKVSGPLMDRIDIHIDVPAVKYRELATDRTGDSSETIRARVEHAREVQRKRLGPHKLYSNAQMGQRHIRKFCAIGPDSQHILEMAHERLGLSARAYARILKVSRTIADIDGSSDIQTNHVAEAIQYRTLDRSI